MKRTFLSILNEDVYSDFTDRVLNEDDYFKIKLNTILWHIEKKAKTNMPVDELTDFLIEKYPTKAHVPSIQTITKNLNGFLYAGALDEAITFIKNLIDEKINENLTDELIEYDTETEKNEDLSDETISKIKEFANNYLDENTSLETVSRFNDKYHVHISTTEVEKGNRCFSKLKEVEIINKNELNSKLTLIFYTKNANNIIKLMYCLSSTESQMNELEELDENYRDASSTYVIGEGEISLDKELKNIDLEKGMRGIRRDVELYTGTRELLKPKIHKNKAKYNRKTKHKNNQSF